jgi:hypothetical protein
MPNDIATQRNRQGLLAHAGKELRAAGFAPQLLPVQGGITAGGVTMQVDLQKLAATDLALQKNDLLDCLARGFPVNLALSGFSGGERSEMALYEFCEALRHDVCANSSAARRLGTSLRSHQMSLQAYQVICDASLGCGPRYVVFDSLQMQQHSNRRVESATQSNWRYLCARRGAPRSLTPVYAGAVSSQCPLLADEAAASVLPALGIAVPCGSAWLPLALELTRFSDGNGVLAWARLSRALAVGVRAADQLFDSLCWANGAQRADAEQNRRIAVYLTGLGELIRQQGADPADLSSLKFASRTVARVRACLWSASSLMARQKGPLPALVQSDPSMCWRDAEHRRNWQRRWHHALSTTAVRNRNLLVLSPYSVLPASGRLGFAFSDLLPVLKQADALAFAYPPDLSSFSSAEFVAFHQRAWAQVQGQYRTSFVAAGV